MPIKIILKQNKSNKQFKKIKNNSEMSFMFIDEKNRRVDRKKEEKRNKERKNM